MLGFQFPSLGMYHPADFLEPVGPGGDGGGDGDAARECDPELVEVKLESAPSLPLTKKRKRDLLDARNDPACKGLKSVAARCDVVDLTDETEDDEENEMEIVTLAS